jgi:hypothetical protein
MERRINKTIIEYITSLKNDFREVIQKTAINDDDKDILIKHVYDYEQLVLTKEDFIKRKRGKNVVPVCDRCSAKRANNDQCTRRRKDGDEFCGTHSKGRPHGVISEDSNRVNFQKVELWAEDIQGIVYYIDKTGNVYQTEDIVNNLSNPKVIAQYVKTGQGYSIPSFNNSK